MQKIKYPKFLDSLLASSKSISYEVKNMKKISKKSTTASKEGYKTKDSLQKPLLSTNPYHSLLLLRLNGSFVVNQPSNRLTKI